MNATYKIHLVETHSLSTAPSPLDNNFDDWDDENQSDESPDDGEDKKWVQIRLLLLPNRRFRFNLI